MDTPRFNVPLAFVQERFVCVLGGLSQPGIPSLTCEGYDIVKSIWFKMKPIEDPRYSTTAVVMDNKAIYLMPGCASESTEVSPSAGMGNLKLLVLNLEKANQFDKADINYVKNLAIQEWTSLIITEPQFNIQ
jgi:hypothetical protein